ncbi:MAG: CPBP family intramembrane glutamic endopeptidase [Candidatus Bathyarchaeia archaeon]
MGFKKSEGWKTNCVTGFIFAIFHNAVYLAISMFIFKVKHGYMLPAYVHIPVYFAFYLLISVSEEGLFRGCIFKGLLQKHKALTSIIFSFTLFGLYHINYISLVLNFSPLAMLFQTAYVFQSFTAGLFLAYLYYHAKGNILSPLSYHFSQMFFNIPFLWTETQPATQIILLGISSTLNTAQIIALFLIRKLKETKHEK